MREAKVITLAISAPGKKVFKLGDTVKESQFPKGRFDELIKGKYIEVTGESQEPAKPLNETETVVTKTDATPDADAAGSDEVKTEEDKKDEPPVDNTIEDTTVKELKVELTKMGVEFGANSTKAELYELWRSKKE